MSVGEDRNLVAFMDRKLNVCSDRCDRSDSADCKQSLGEGSEIEERDIIGRITGVMGK